MTDKNMKNGGGSGPSSDTQFDIVRISGGDAELFASTGAVLGGQFLIGISETNLPAYAVLLDEEQARDLSHALTNKQLYSIAPSDGKCGIRASRSNRGDPYAEGISVEIGAPDGEGQASVFIENGFDLDNLIRFTSGQKS